MFSPLNYAFCPFCSNTLVFREEEGRKRAYCKNCNWTHYPHASVAVAGVVRRGNSVLLVRRARDPFKGYWCIPAGFMEFGESPQETLKREIFEETGLDVYYSTPLANKLGRDDPRAPGVIVIFFDTWASPGELINDDEENFEVAWWPLNDLPQIAFETHKEVLALLTSG